MPFEHWMHVCWQKPEPAPADATPPLPPAMLLPRLSPADQSLPPDRPAAVRGMQSTMPRLSVSCVHNGLTPSLPVQSVSQGRGRGRAARTAASLRPRYVRATLVQPSPVVVAHAVDRDLRHARGCAGNMRFGCYKHGPVNLRNARDAEQGHAWSGGFGEGAGGSRGAEGAGACVAASGIPPGSGSAHETRGILNAPASAASVSPAAFFAPLATMILSRLDPWR